MLFALLVVCTSMAILFIYGIPMLNRKPLVVLPSGFGIAILVTIETVILVSAWQLSTHTSSPLGSLLFALLLTWFFTDLVVQLSHMVAGNGYASSHATTAIEMVVCCAGFLMALSAYSNPLGV